MAVIKDCFRSKWLMLTVFVLGFGIRLLVAVRGHNFDFESFWIVSSIIDRGLNVYASTTRYNYGPIWFNILQLIYFLSSKNEVIFRCSLIIFLSLVDAGIFTILWRRIGSLAACLFFLNPISIIITGYHNQFDNLAILLSMLSVTLIGDDLNQPINRRKFMGLLLSGLSLATKHIFFIFPIWLAVKQKGMIQKIAMICIPFSIFILGFIPYWNEGQPGIIQNVFQYKPHHNGYFYLLFVPYSIQKILSSQMVWIFLLFIFAFIFRKRKSFDSLLLYTCILVGASPAIANQYLAIVVPFVSTYLNPLTLLYTIVGAWFLLIDRNGLHSTTLQQIANIPREWYYAILTSLLCFGFILSIIPKQINDVLKWILLEVKIQLGYEERE